MAISLIRLAASLLVVAVAACASPPRPESAASTSPRELREASPATAPQEAEEQEPAQGAEGGEAEQLAKQLANPVASLISVPFQLNYDDDIGAGDGERLALNVQPVVPISLTEDWNLISRTILPVVDQDGVPPGRDESGIGDILQSAFFSPVEPTEGGWIWGAGPVLLLPTASDETLGTERWATGPTGVALKQQGPWTYGVLANHLWSFAGDDDRADINSTFVQPFLSYTTPTGTSYTLNAESTYDWEASELALPINAVASKVVNLGGQLVSVGGGLRYWAEDSPASPEGLGFRFVVTLLFPK